MSPKLRVVALGARFLGVQDPLVGRPFVARYEKGEGGRLNVVGWYFDPRLSPEPLTNDVFRSVSVTRIEAIINRRDNPAIIGLRGIIAELEPGTSEQGGRPEADAGLVDITIDLAIDQFVKMLREGDRRAPRSKSVRLRVPDTKRFGDEFYARVADVYLELLERNERPIVALAEANDRPYKTVAAWVREARRRGMLPPGRAGKAG
jgi:hypothetical protein